MSIRSCMSDIPEDRYEAAFGKKDSMRVTLEKQDSHKVIESEFDSHTRYNDNSQKFFLEDLTIDKNWKVEIVKK